MNTMTGAEFRALREYLGLTNPWLADYLGVAERSVVRWGDAVSPVPEGVAADMLELDAIARNDVAQKAAWLADQGPANRELITYRTDDALQLINSSDRFPASWHRAIAARVRERVEGVRLTFAPEV